MSAATATRRLDRRAAGVILAALALVGCKAKEEPAPAGGPASAPAGPAAAPASKVTTAAGGEIKVAGASDLVFAMEELGPRFTRETGVAVVFIPGSSGKLAAQIKEGAPFDVFLSANMAFVEDAVKAGACLEDTRALYAYGRVVLWTRDAGPELPTSLAGLTDRRYARIAIAQPEHAPYGAAAKAALEKLGVWAALAPRVVYGSNVKDTMQMAETGNADVALIALALAKKSGGHYIEIPVDLHPPIAQGMAVCRTKDEKSARAFVDFMKSPATRELLVSYGFGPPDA